MAKNKVHERNLQELSNKYPNLNFDNFNYLNNKTKGKVTCRYHGDFFITMNSLKSGKECKYCKIEKKRKKYNEVLKKELKNKYPNLDVTNFKSYTKTQKSYIYCLTCKKEFKDSIINMNNRKYGCSYCTSERIIDKKSFINKANKIYDNKYDYSKFQYINSLNKSIIICPIHGEFKKSANNHIHKVRPQECPICSQEKQKELLKKDINLIKLQIKEIYKNNIQIIELNYKNCYSKGKFKCMSCGKTFIKTLRNLLNGYGCYRCSNNKRTQIRDTEDFIWKSRKKHGDKYNYSKSMFINSTTKIIIICPKHGEFKQLPSSHVNKNTECPKCCSSKGEKEVRRILNKHNINFKEQFKIKECLNILPLPFDFVIFKNSRLQLLIEYDGELHYKEWHKPKKGQNRLREIRKRDRIKTNYCNINNIPLLRIPYWERENIETIILKKLKEKGLI
jgi:hypothetical protein